MDTRDEPYTTTTRRLTTRASRPTTTTRLGSNAVIANGASTLLNYTSTALLGTLGRLTKVGSSILLVNPSIVGPVRRLGVGRLNGGGPELRASRILVTLTVSTATSRGTTGTVRGLYRLGGYRVRSSILLTRISRGILGGLNIHLADRPTGGWAVG